MKILRFLVAALALLLSSSCEKQIDGGYIHVHIFIYTGEGKELINAHGYRYSIPAEGGNFSIGIVSYGLRELVPTEKCKGISASFLFEDPIPEERIYEDQGDGVYRYLQRVDISAEPNSGRRAREFKFILYSNEYSGLFGEAEITVRQSGR